MQNLSISQSLEDSKLGIGRTTIQMHDEILADQFKINRAHMTNLSVGQEDYIGEPDLEAS